MIIGQEKPPLDELAHHGVKGMHWGIRNREDRHLNKVKTNLENSTAKLKRLRDGNTKGVGEKVTRAVGIAGNLGSKKAHTAALNNQIALLNSQHQKVVARLNTPHAERHMRTDTKVKIALGGVVAARVLYVAGGLALNTIVGNKLASNAAADKGLSALTKAATAVNYAKKSKGAFKITTIS